MYSVHWHELHIFRVLLYRRAKFFCGFCAQYYINSSIKIFSPPQKKEKKILYITLWGGGGKGAGAPPSDLELMYNYWMILIRKPNYCWPCVALLWTITTPLSNPPHENPGYAPASVHRKEFCAIASYYKKVTETNIISNETVSRMVVQKVHKCRGAPCITILILLLAIILVCVCFAPPSLLTVSFEMIFILVIP